MRNEVKDGPERLYIRERRWDNSFTKKFELRPALRCLRPLDPHFSLSKKFM